MKSAVPLASTPERHVFKNARDPAHLLDRRGAFLRSSA